MDFTPLKKSVVITFFLCEKRLLLSSGYLSADDVDDDVCNYLLGFLVYA